MFEPGALIDKYRVLRQIGEGGMGAVFAAEHVVLRRMAAVKVLHANVAMNAEIAQRFVNEAVGAASLNHRNIVGVHDCGQLPGTSGALYIALEYLEGEPLSRFLHARAGQPIDLGTIVRILGEAANGLHTAHEAGIVHRDVKPDNLFLVRTADGADIDRVVVLDFGIAKAGEHAHGLETRSNVIMGTPAYMAPEQLRDTKSADRRADVFALGVIAYEMATGHRPWGDATSAFAIIDYHARATAAPNPRKLRDEIPKKFAAVVAKALDPDPQRRYPTTKAFVLALANETPSTGWSQSGISILQRFAVEMTQGDATSDTVGRHVPSALQSGPVTTPLRDPAPLSVSSGVPYTGQSPGTQPMGSAGGGVPPMAISTIASSSGQAFATPAPVAAKGRRPLLIGAIVAAGVSVAVVAILLATQGSEDAAPVREQATPAVAVVDAGPPVADAAPSPRMATLVVETSPAGGVVMVGGLRKGKAPVDVVVEVGSEVMVRAELEGHEPTVQTVRVTEAPAPVQLTLAPLAAEVPVAGPVSERSGGTSGKPKRPRGEPKKPGTGSGSAAGAGSGSVAGPRFNPNDVGGD